MKTQAEYQKAHRERFMAKNNYKPVLMYVNSETNARLEELVRIKGRKKREILNFMEMG